MAITFDHHQLGVAFGILGNIISFLVYLAPLPTFYRIYLKKSTESFQSLPYLVALFSSMLWFYYALLKQNAFLLVTINSFGCVIETLYIILFITYAPKDSRNSTVKLLVAMNVGVFSLILLLTHFLATGSTRILILGWICVAFSVSVFAAPLSIVARVIRTKSVEFMPFCLSFFLTLSAIMWFAYGLFLKDICVAVPNIVGFLLGLIQMLLYSIYKNANKVIIEEKKLPEVQLENIVVLGNLGASEVHPVDIHPDAANGVNKQETKENHHHHHQETDQRNQNSLEVSSDDLQLQQHNGGDDDNNNNNTITVDECAVVIV